VSVVPVQDIDWLVMRLRAVVMAGPAVCGDMTLPQLTALHFIGALAPVSLTKLAQALGTKPPATSAMVDRLIQARLVCRTPDPRDGRRVELNLTMGAQQAVGHTDLRAAMRLRAVTSGMSPEARQHLIDVLIDTMRRSPRVVGPQ
jgi:DNA-binding MarR family transcriptional regulator